MKKDNQPKKPNIFILSVTGIIAVISILAWLAGKWDKGADPNTASYTLRTYDTQAEGEHIALLNAVEDKDLQQFRCTMQFINNGENKYFWRLTTQHDIFDEVEDKIFLSIIHAVDGSLPENRMLISGRFCETKDQTMYMDYYTSDRASSYAERGYYDGSEVEGYLTSFQIATGEHTSPIKFTTQKKWPYTGCKKPLQIASDHSVYLTCGIVETHSAVNTIYKIHIPSSTITELQTCTYSREGELTKTCTVHNSQD